jgi:hypothetical protein
MLLGELFHKKPMLLTVIVKLATSHLGKAHCPLLLWVELDEEHTV